MRRQPLPSVRIIGRGLGDAHPTRLGLDDLDSVVEQLRNNGVVFEEYDLPGFKTVNGIADIAGERGAWFKDSEGNLLAVGERVG